MGTSRCNAGGNPAMDWHPIHWGNKNTSIHFMSVISLGCFLTHHIMFCHNDCNALHCPWFQVITTVPGNGNKLNKTHSGLSSLVPQMTLLFHSVSNNKLQKGRLLSFTDSLIKDTLCQWLFLNLLTNWWASYSKAEVNVCLLATINIILIVMLHRIE